MGEPRLPVFGRPKPAYNSMPPAERRRLKADKDMATTLRTLKQHAAQLERRRSELLAHKADLDRQITEVTVQIQQHQQREEQERTHG